MISDDEYLERVVAGINAISNPNADVQWNAEIGGRQFDVMVNFEAGIYRFLILIEVKDWKKKIAAEQIEAFVTKASDKLANKMVFVAKSGYQSGAIDVARKHGVELFEVRFDAGDLSSTDDRTFVIQKKDANGEFRYVGQTKSINSHDRTVSLGEPQMVNRVGRCWLCYSNGSISEFPNEETQMRYYVENSKFSDGRSVREVFSEVTTVPYPMNSTNRKIVTLPTPLLLLPPDEYFVPSGAVVSVEVEITTTMGVPLRGNAQLEPSAISPNVHYTNVISGKTFTANAANVPLGQERLQVGEFYFEYFPLRYFYCAEVGNDVIKLYLVESFQNGRLFSGVITLDAKDSKFLIRVGDTTTIKRLNSRLRKFRAGR